MEKELYKLVDGLVGSRNSLSSRGETLQKDMLALAENVAAYEMLIDLCVARLTEMGLPYPKVEADKCDGECS